MPRAQEGGGVGGNEGTRADCQNVAGPFLLLLLLFLDTASRKLWDTVFFCFFLKAFNCSERLPLIPKTVGKIFNWTHFAASRASD